MLIGLAGIIVPVIPGVIIVWLGLFVYAIGTGFATISIPAVVIFFVLTALTFALDFVIPMLGMKKYRASNWALLGSFLGFIIGITVFGIWGLILGPIIGAFVAELIVRRNLKQGAQAALGSLLGTVVGTLLKLTLSLIMIGYFIWTFFQ
jgi:uncharacterized protein YqgC (DUF456 family)